MKAKLTLYVIASFVVAVFVMTTVWLLNDSLLVNSNNYPYNSYWSDIIVLAVSILLASVFYWLCPLRRPVKRLLVVGSILLISASITVGILLKYGERLHGWLG